MMVPVSTSAIHQRINTTLVKTMKMMIAVRTAPPGRICAPLQGLLDFAAETRFRQPLAGIGLHGARWRRPAPKHGGGLRQRILGLARQTVDPSARTPPAATQSAGCQQDKARKPGLVITIHRGGADDSSSLRKRGRYRAPTADLIWVVSAVRREISSPLRAESKMPATATPNERTRRAQIRDDALADGHHQIDATRWRRLVPRPSRSSR